VEIAIHRRPTKLRFPQGSEVWIIGCPKYATAGKSGLIGPFKMSTESTKAALFETRYHNALTAYVQQEMEDALMDAFELGRKALAEGHGLLDLIAIHHTLLASLIEQSSNGADIQRHVARAREFLTQAAAPLSTQRSFPT
jgi:hypothetical protein